MNCQRPLTDAEKIICEAFVKELPITTLVVCVHSGRNATLLTAVKEHLTHKEQRVISDAAQLNLVSIDNRLAETFPSQASSLDYQNARLSLENNYWPDDNS